MAKLSFPLFLVVVLLNVLFCTVSGVTLDEVFVVHPGRTHGGCDDYFDQTTKKGTLDDWLQETISSLQVAVQKLNIDQVKQDIKIRRVLNMFFNVPNRKPVSANAQNMIDTIVANLGAVLNFFILPDPPLSPTTKRYLYCGSDFLVQQSPDAQARDYQGQGIVDAQGQPVAIAQVPEYAAAIKAEPGSVPWWSGDHTDHNGYYFSPIGGRFCEGHNLGLTAFVTEMEPDGAGLVTTHQLPIVFTVLCPQSFTNVLLLPGKEKQPESYKVGDESIAVGTNLADVVPRSASLLHEAFHVVFGAGDYGFLQGNKEIYDIGKVTELAQKNQEDALRNPENYVFLVAHFYYLYGVQMGGAVASIDKNWDFASRMVKKRRIWAAKTPK